MKVWVFDVETSYKIGAVWSAWKNNIGIEQLLQDTFILSWSGKWLDDDYIYSDALHYHSIYKDEPENDIKILESLHAKLDEADIVIAHNGDRFDVPVLNTRFITQGMMPPSAYKSIDTLKVARNNFKFTLNRLDALGMFLGVGRKVDTGGFKLWKDIVLDHDKKAFDKMVEYNEQDVNLLETVYKKLAPWDKKHPSFSIYTDLNTPICNVCGSKELRRNGTYCTSTQKYQKYQCKSCGHSSRSRQAIKMTKEERENLLRSI